MTDQIIQAEAVLLTEDDQRKRALVETLMQSQNQRIADFAKHLVSLSFSAIGVVLALKDKWLGAVALPYQKMWLGIAIILFLMTALLGTLAISTYVHRATLSDYANVDAELNRVARLRARLTRSGFALSVVATVIVVFIAF